MDQDKTMPVVVLIGAVYTWGTLNQGWTSPVDITVGIACRMGGHRWCGHQNSWSDEGEDDEAFDGDEMSTQDAHPADEPPTEDVPADLSAPLGPPRVLRVPAPADPLAKPSRLEGDDVQELRRGETRMAWVRRQLEAGLLSPGEIDQVGADKFGVDKRTVRRWRQAVHPSRIKDAAET